MNIDMPEEYYRQKKDLLNQCVHLGEELLNSLKSWELLPGILDKREEVIRQLKHLEMSLDKKVAALLPLEKRQELDGLLNLVLQVDKACAGQIHTEQQDILDSLKNNIKGQRLMQYAQVHEPEQGKILDYKK